MHEQEQEDARRALAHKQGEFLDGVMEAGRIKNDRELSRVLEMSPPVISKIRNGHMAVSPSILVAISEVTGLQVGTMKQQLGYKILNSRNPQ